LDAAIYPTEKDQMIFAKQYLMGDATTAWDRCCALWLEGNHNLVAVKDHFYTWMAPIKYHTNTVF
jgi:hypothetical protein